jgi:hypothetical protein
MHCGLANETCVRFLVCPTRPLHHAAFLRLSHTITFIISHKKWRVVPCLEHTQLPPHLGAMCSRALSHLQLLFQELFLRTALPSHTQHNTLPTTPCSQTRHIAVARARTWLLWTLHLAHAVCAQSRLLVATLAVTLACAHGSASAGDVSTVTTSSSSTDPEIASMWRELESAIARGHPLTLHTGSSNRTRFSIQPPIDCTYPHHSAPLFPTPSNDGLYIISSSPTLHATDHQAVVGHARARA